MQAWPNKLGKLSATKREREQVERLKEHTLSETQTHFGAKLLKLRPMPADGAEYCESLEWRRV